MACPKAMCYTSFIYDISVVNEDPPKLHLLNMEMKIVYTVIWVFFA
jgi:hypothetical protein